MWQNLTAVEMFAFSTQSNYGMIVLVLTPYIFSILASKVILYK